MKRPAALVCAVLLVTATVPATAQQGSALASITTLARGSNNVVVATALTVDPSWQTNAYGDRLIISHIGSQVTETLKGTPTGAAQVEIEGGTIGNLTLRVSSQTPVQVGDRAVFFLDTTPSGVQVPHLKGYGILKLDANNQVPGFGLTLDDVRGAVQAGAR